MITARRVAGKRWRGALEGQARAAATADVIQLEVARPQVTVRT